MANVPITVKEPMPEQSVEAVQIFDSSRIAILGDSLRPLQTAWVRSLIDFAYKDGIKEGLRRAIVTLTAKEASDGDPIRQ